MLRVSVGFCMEEDLRGGVLAEFGGGIAVGYEGLRMLLSLSFSPSLSLSLSLCAHGRSSESSCMASMCLWIVVGFAMRRELWARYDA